MEESLNLYMAVQTRSLFKIHLCIWLCQVFLPRSRHKGSWIFFVTGGIFFPSFICSMWDPHFLGGSMVKDLPANAGASGLIPLFRRSPRGGNGNPLQYSCLENPRDRGAWPAMVHGVAEGQTELSTWQIDTYADKAAVRTVISDMI